MKPSPRLRRPFVCVFVMLSASSLAGAQTWNATSATGNWSDATRWTPNTVPDAIGAAVTISSNITATNTVTIDTTSRTIGTLIIGDTGTRSNAFNLAASGGASLILDNGASAASITATASMVNQSISAPLLLRSATTNLINNNNDSGTARTQTFSGTISSDTASTKNIVVSGANVRASVAISGVISNGTGTLSLTKDSSNILTLSGANTFSGGTTLNGGFLLLNNAAALGTGSLTITGGAIGTSLGSNPAATVTLNNHSQFWNGNFAVGGFTPTGAQTLNTGTGTVTMNANRSIALNGTGATGSVSRLVVGGVISDGGNGYSLTTTGANGAAATLELSGANTYTGGTNINGGVVRFTSTGAIPATGTIAIGDNGSLAVGGAYSTVAAWLSSGKVATSSTGSLGLESSTADAWNPGASGYNSLSLGAALGSTVAYTGSYTPTGNTYRIGGGGGTIQFTIADTFTGANAMIVGGGGGGRTVISAANSFTGDVTVRQGTTLDLSNSNALGTTASAVTVELGGGIELRGGITVANKTLSAVGTSSTASPSNVIASLASVSGVNEWSGNIAADTTANVRFSASSGATLNLTGDTTLTGTGSLVLTGAGTGVISGDIGGDVGAVGSTSGVYAIIQNGGSNWTLSGTNTFADSVRIDNGSISVSSIATNLGSSTFAIGLGETTGTGRLIYTGSGNETTARGFILRSTEASGAGGGIIEQAGSGILTINGSVTSSSTASAKTFTLTGSSAGSGVLNGTISNGGGGSVTNFVKSGTGAWTLGGANGYTGTTNITGGTLTVTGSVNSTTSVSVSNATFAIGATDAVNNNATIGLGANSVLQMAGFTDILGALTVTGSATLDLIGDNNLTFASGTITSGGINITNWNDADNLLFTSTSTIGSQLGSIFFTNPAGYDPGVYSAALSGNEIVPVPEPSSVIVLAVGGAALALRRRRR